MEAVSVALSSRCKFPSSFNIEPDFMDSPMRPAGGLVELKEQQATEKEVKITTGDRKSDEIGINQEPTTNYGYSV